MSFSEWLINGEYDNSDAFETQSQYFWSKQYYLQTLKEKNTISFSILQILVDLLNNSQKVECHSLVAAIQMFRIGEALNN